jgi:hypothetical protein
MDKVPNRAAGRVYEQAERWHRPEYLESDASDDLAGDFVREDRRRLVGVPGFADASEYIEQQKLWSELGHGPHTLHIDEVIGHRDDRWVGVRLRIAYEDGFAIEVLAVFQFDEAVERTERMVVFDPDDVEGALAELDRPSGRVP